METERVKKKVEEYVQKFTKLYGDAKAYNYVKELYAIIIADAVDEGDYKLAEYYIPFYRYINQLIEERRKNYEYQSLQNQ